MNKTLSVAYSIAFPHALWRMDFHPGAHYMAVELRNADNGLPYFTVFNYQNGQLVLENFVAGDRWWTLTAITEDHLLLSYYSNPEMPNTSALSSISLHKRQSVWEKYNLIMEGQTTDGPIVQLVHMPNGFLSLLDASTGQTVKNYTPGQAIPYLDRPVLHPTATDAVPPFIFGDEGIFGPWHYAHYKGLDIWAVHEQKSKGFQIRLIVSREQEILHDEVIIDNLAKLLLEIFFIIDDHLFVISSNKRQIIAYKV